MYHSGAVSCRVVPSDKYHLGLLRGRHCDIRVCTLCVCLFVFLYVFIFILAANGVTCMSQL